MTLLKSIACAALASVALIGSAASAQAQTHDFSGSYFAADIGGASGQSHGDAIYDPLNQKLSGIVVTVSAGERMNLDDRLVVGLEASGSFGNVKASGSYLDCTIANCGYDETATVKHETSLAFSVGGSIGYRTGPILVSIKGGVEAANYRRSFSYTSGGLFPDYTYEQSGYRAGPYLGASVELPIHDRWLVMGEVHHSELTELGFKSTGGDSASVFKETRFSFGLVRQF